MAISSTWRSAGEARFRDGDRDRTTAVEHPDLDLHRLIDSPGAGGGELEAANDLRYGRAITAFIWLGIALRVGHYLINYPLWGDEAFLAYNFVRRGYLGLLSPLEYGQICPILFLWAELTAVKLFGFTELSLRFWPLICGIASVLLFRHVAGRVLAGRALLLAVAIFAVSIHPIRHSADAKPYASDLLVALGLVALAIEWYRRPDQAKMLWLLAGFVPIALAASYPALIVAAAIAVTLAPTVWKTHRRNTTWAFVAYVAVFATSIGTMFVVNTRYPRNPRVVAALNKYWSDSFPPLDSPVRLTEWLITTHAGNMLAYPWGGNRGASSGTLLLVVVAGFVLWRRDRKTLLTLLVVAPLALALAAAAVKRYPYGGQARIMQYIAPGVCIMAGLGLASLLALLRRRSARILATRIAAAALAIGGIATFADEFRHPYRAVYDDQARTFAREFWPAQARDAELLCLQSDVGIRSGRRAVSRTALYLCNQHIYAPNRRLGAEPRWDLITHEHPLRCVVFDDVHLESPATSAWIAETETKYHLRRRIDLSMPTTDLDMSRSYDRVYVFEFEPRVANSSTPVAVKTESRLAR